MTDDDHVLLRAADAHWRESNQMKVLNTDLAKQLAAAALGARIWRLRPGQASTKHCHLKQEELYVLLEGEGKIRIGDDTDPLTIEPLDSLLIRPATVRQIFNDTDADALWLVVGAPPESANTLEMTAQQLTRLYPEGPKSLPPELADGSPVPRRGGGRQSPAAGGPTSTRS